MKVILHNPSHNGDQLHTLGIVTQLINDNPDKHFTIIPACAMYLFRDLLSDRVNIEEHPVLWDCEKNVFNKQNFISENHNTLWNFIDGDIYINTWKLLVQDNYNCISLVNRPAFIKNLLSQIYTNTGIRIIFNCNDYKELIPVLPNVNLDIVVEKIKSYNKKVIFFYNQNSCCGIENSYPRNINDQIIDNLISKYANDHIIILSKPCNKYHKNLINVESEFSNIPSLDGKNLIVNAYIANLCNEVYFKTNGGSLFILNKKNIDNNNVQYKFIGQPEWQSIYCNEYGLNSTLTFV